MQSIARNITYQYDDAQLLHHDSFPISILSPGTLTVSGLSNTSSIGLAPVAT
jgi:hypothetical protein